MAWACMTASGTGSIIFIDVTHVARMRSEFHSGNLQRDASNRIRRKFIMHQDYDPIKDNDHLHPRRD